MALDNNRLDDFAGMDEIVVNQRVRAIRPGTPYASVAAPNNGSFGTLWMQGTGIASNLSTGTPQTISAQQLGTGIILQAPAAATTWTLDTAANILTYMNNNSAGVQVGDILVCDVINSGTNNITITFGTGGAFDTGQSSLTMVSNTSRTLFVRMTNVSSTPSYTVYG